ncbi:inner membrane protein [Legionella lansingensis]|uniref:cyclic-guanylate-specific phosphodiesterase n=1 Tax=Legionella lansingensis TaxID=45067 RepID=A0A0W0VRN9_9GAMM|nr:EAL domain-containing protein [Legionella lansingensis]KTD22703.1 inner membrane protein [Legionella lansingensis]SNV55427.1 inner membrane protein [Legionella lansingensis]
MRLKNSKKADILQEIKRLHTIPSNRILDDQIHLLYEQNPFGIIAQCLAAMFLVIAIWPVAAQEKLIGWLIYLLVVSGCWFSIAIAYKVKETLYAPKAWLKFFTLFTFLSGCAWGFASSILMPTENLIYQSFVVILIFGITAGSLPFFSPVISTYAFFLFPAFIPFTIWLFSQGGIYVLLGFCGLIYMPIIFISCYYSNKFLINFLSLQYKNINLGTLNQLLERRVAKRTSELEKSLAITKSTLESTADGLLVTDLKGNIEYYNQKFMNMWEMSLDFINKADLFLLMEEMLSQLKYANEFIAKVDELKENPEQEGYQDILLKNGNIFEWHSKPHKLRHVIVGYVWSFRDITVRKQMEKQLAYQANHDLLTDLPNRTLLYDRINQAIAYAKRYQTELVLMFLDIDNFKLINDNLGHSSGDLLLKKIAKRLISCTRESDTVARFGGDEFVILFPLKGQENISQLSQRILGKIAKPLQVLNREIVVTASIGASIFPKHGKDPATLLKNADMAMYLAKKARNNFKIFDKTLDEQTRQSLELQIDLRNALIAGEFFLLYQPTINLKTGELVGVEALVRWRHPAKGILLPINFIHAAEESSIIIPLGEWIFTQACLQNRTWQKDGLRPIRMAINVSGVQLARDNFVDFIEFTLAETQLPPQCIEIELTESIVMDDKKQNLHKLKQLKELGVSLTIDDFGTGYSSLNYLKEFPVDKLKIDQSFTQDCITDHNDASIIQAIIAMGHSLKLRVLAEGIETSEQLEFLKFCNCDEGQGFFYGYPMPAKTFAKILEENKNYRFEKIAK